MDTTAQNVWKEMMRKENAFHKQWEKENENRYGEGSVLNPTVTMSPTSTEKGTKPLSSHRHFLDQSLGLVASPHATPRNTNGKEAGGQKDKRRPSGDLLYFGVSKDGEGRHAYLKSRALKGPQEKFGRPITSAAEVGWTAPTIVTASGSPFAHKPLIKNTFYRSSGAMNYT